MNLHVVGGSCWWAAGGFIVLNSLSLTAALWLFVVWCFQQALLFLFLPPFFLLSTSNRSVCNGRSHTCWSTPALWCQLKLYCYVVSLTVFSTVYHSHICTHILTHAQMYTYTKQPLMLCWPVFIVLYLCLHLTDSFVNIKISWRIC